MSKQGKDRIIVVTGPSSSPNEYYMGKFCVEGLWFTLQEMKEKFQLFGLRTFPKKYSRFKVKRRGGR